MISFKGKSHWA